MVVVEPQRERPVTGSELRGGLRQWPRSKKSHRIVPVPGYILESMSALMTGRPRNALVFTARKAAQWMKRHGQ
jgi:hypothetical protein